MAKLDRLMQMMANGQHLPTHTQILSADQLAEQKAAAQMQRIYSDFRQQCALHTFTGSGLIRLLNKTKKRVRNEVAGIHENYAKDCIAKLDEMIQRAKQSKGATVK
jgi:hypothetical protein